MKTYNVYFEGKVVATHKQNESTFKALKEIIARRKNARRDSRLINLSK